ncbi:hypothetical protein LZ31DRAFT_68383 [Colletotrichum somersetense]|nr:hypothetical protein LZ31DRAFT_68383 [Colletotrichum somersetense]
MPQSMPSSSPPHTTYTLHYVPSDCPYHPYLPDPGDSASTGLALRYHPWRREVPLTFFPSPQLTHFTRRCLVVPLCFARTLGQETESHSGQQRHSSQFLWHRRNRHPVHLDIGQLPAAINRPCLYFSVPQCSQKVSVLSTMLQRSPGPGWTLLCMYIVHCRCSLYHPSNPASKNVLGLCRRRTIQRLPWWTRPRGEPPSINPVSRALALGFC